MAFVPPEAQQSSGFVPPEAQQGFVPPEAQQPSQAGFLDNVGGYVAGAGDVLTQGLFALPLQAAGATEHAFGVPSQQAQEDVNQALGMIHPFASIQKAFGQDITQTPGYQGITGLAGKFGEGINYVAGQVAKRTGMDPANARLLANSVAAAAPIPLEHLGISAMNHIVDRITGEYKSGNIQAPPASNKTYGMPDPNSPTGQALNQLWETESGGRQFDSNGNPIKSSAGASGIGQLLPSTGREAAKLAGVPWDSNRFANDVDYNKQLSAAYFQKQLDNFNGDYSKAFAAYNAGPKWVEQAQERAANAPPGSREADWQYQLATDGRSDSAHLETAQYVRTNMAGLESRSRGPWQYPSDQAEMFQAINPYDVAGHVTGAIEGRETTLGEEPGGQQDMFSQTPEETPIGGPTAPETIQRPIGEQGELFNQGNVMAYGPYDPYKPNPAPMSFDDWKSTMQSLSDSDKTGMRGILPGDQETQQVMYEEYLDQVSNSQQGLLFGRDSQQAAFGVQPQFNATDISGRQPPGPGKVPQIASQVGQGFPETPQPMGDMNQLLSGLPAGTPLENPMASLPGTPLNNKIPSRSEAIPETPTGRVAEPTIQATRGIPGLSSEMERETFHNYTPESVIEQASNEKDAPNNFAGGQFNSGANLTGRTRGSTLIKGLYTFWKDATSKFNMDNVSTIIPAGKAIVKLSSDERVALSTILKNEMFNRQRLDPGNLSKFSPKVQDAYIKVRALLDKSGEMMNRGRVAQGLDPVSMQEAYLASVWRGRFGMRIEDPQTGKLLMMLRSKTPRDLDRQVQAIKQRMPDAQYTSFTMRNRGGDDTIDMAYHDMLKLLDKDDPRSQVIQSIYEDHMSQVSSDQMGMLVHGIPKANIKGFIGNRPDKSDIQNANQLLNEQLKFARSQIKYGHDQEAAAKSFQVLSDPTLQQMQPNNTAYGNAYVKHALGMDVNKNIQGIQSSVNNVVDSLASTLHLPTTDLQHAVALSKAYFYAKEFGFSAREALMNVMQTAFTLPMLMRLRSVGFQGDILKAYANTMRDMVGTMTGKMSPEMQQAYDWAHKRGSINLAQIDEVKDAGSSFFRHGVGKFAAIGHLVAERFARTISFMTAVHFLRDSGLSGEELYRTAEAHSTNAMVDYNHNEQPFAMSRYGVLSQMAGTMKVYPANAINNLISNVKLAARAAETGNYRLMVPLVGLMATQAFMGGSTGLYGIGDLTKLLDKTVTPIMAHYNPEKYGDFSFASSLIEHTPDWFNYGMMSKLANVRMWTSFNQGDLAGGDSVMSALLPFFSTYSNITDKAMEAWKNDFNTKSIAALGYAAAPESIKGMMENYIPAYTGPGGVSLQPSDINKGQYKRSATDRALRNFGLTSFNEAAFKDKMSVEKEREKQTTENVGNLPERYWAAVDRGDSAEVAKLGAAIAQFHGPGAGVDAIINFRKNQIINQQMTAAQQKMLKAPTSQEGVVKFNRYGEINGGR